MREGIGNKKAPDGGVTKVVEMGGESISKGLFKTDPFRAKGCPFPTKCAIGDKGGTCTLQRVIYELECQYCKEGGGGGTQIATYRGQSG